MAGQGFDYALAGLRYGERMRRTGWNGKGMWIALVKPHGEQLVVPCIARPRPWRLGDPSLPVNVEHLRVLPYIAMKTADGGWVPWLASQTDILADDWETAE